MPFFREIQYMRHVWWVMLLILGIALLMWWAFYEQIVSGRPWGSNPGPDWLILLFWFIFGLIFPIGFYLMRLVVEVYEDHVSIRYIPLSHHQIAMNEIRNVDAISYRPIREYGGWGIRGLSNRRAYTISGDRGVKLALKDGRTILIGSKKPEELALAIDSKLPMK